MIYYEVLIQISLGYPSVKGRLHTRYAPVRRSLNPKTYTPRLACVKPAASVHPEPGSNSSSYIVCFNHLKLIIMRQFSIGSFQISRFHYSYSFVPICIGTAVNSICLRTCLLFNFACVSKRVQKYTLY